MLNIKVLLACIIIIFSTNIYGMQEKALLTKDDIYKNMTIHLLWINAVPNEKQEYIFPTIWERGNEKIDMIGRIIEWARNYPAVVVWYDARSLAKGQLQKTRSVLAERAKSLDENILNKIRIRSINNLQIINDNPDTIQTPPRERRNLYFDLDLMRVIASYETLMNPDNKLKGERYVLYTDFSLNPESFSKDKVLTEEAVSTLNKFGIIQGKSKTRAYENSFHIWSNRPHLLKAIKLAIIDVNINRKRNAAHYYPQDTFNKMMQIVYDSYPMMFSVFYDLENLVEYKVPQCPQKDIKAPRWSQMGDHELAQCILNEFNFMRHNGTIHNLYNKRTFIDKSVEPLFETMKGLGVYIPTLGIEVPGSHFG
jgi:hypothetical protein